MIIKFKILHRNRKNNSGYFYDIILFDMYIYKYNSLHII